MTLSYQAVTSNCGNDSIGKVAARELGQLINDNNLDFMIINCQEVNFKKTLDQLIEAMGKGEYEVRLLANMPTHTKFTTQFHNRTGIATYMIHKKNLSVKIESDPIHVRRGLHGSSFNKGGLITNLTISNTVDKNAPIHLQIISGHLDSKNIAKRTEDWGNLQKASAGNRVSNFLKLLETAPDIKIAGYDANTRNKLNITSYKPRKSKEINLWALAETAEELKGLQQAPFGGVRYSLNSTYKTSTKDITIQPDIKRPGYARGGMLDFVEMMSNEMKNSMPGITQGDVRHIGSGKEYDPSTKRDHDVIVSPIHFYEGSASPFEAIKNLMAIQLDPSAPGLAKKIRQMQMNRPENQSELVQIYNEYLSKDGLLAQQVELQAKTLGCLKLIEKIDPIRSEYFRPFLIKKTPWFDSEPNLKLAQQKEAQALQKNLINAIKTCTTSHDLNNILLTLSTPFSKIEAFPTTLQVIKSKASSAVAATLFKPIKYIIKTLTPEYQSKAHKNKLTKNNGKNFESNRFKQHIKSIKPTDPIPPPKNTNNTPK